MPYFNLWDSLVKEISYLGNICKEPFTLEFQNQKKVFAPPQDIKISENFYRGEECLNCGRCCVGFWSIWIDDEVDKLEEIYPVEEIMWLDGYEFKINGKTHIMWVHDHTKRPCNFRQDDKCMVHRYNPLHCRMPHIKFKRVKDVTYVTKEQFGRNWKFGCPVKFREYTLNDHEWDKDLFQRIDSLGEMLNVKTQVHEIWQDIEEDCTKL